MPHSQQIRTPIVTLPDSNPAYGRSGDTPLGTPPTPDGLSDQQLLESPISASLRDSGSTDPWINRARPSFLYVMYILLLWAIPVGLIAAIRPEIATAIARGMTDYLSAIPDPLYALFGTGYLGYTAAREWGKSRA